MITTDSALPGKTERGAARNDRAKGTSVAELVRVAIGLIWREGSLLVGRRAAGSVLGGCAEFPGGKCNAGESFADACARECREETGLEVEVLARRLALEHEYPHGRLALEFFDCRPRAPAANAALAARPPFEWIELERVLALPFPPANRALLESLAQNPMALDAR